MDEATKLMAMFERQNADGTYAYSDEDVRHFLPMLVLSGGLDPNATPNIQKLMDEFGQKAGLSAELSLPELRKKILAYYKDHPVNPKLAEEFASVVEALSTDKSAASMEKAQKSMSALRGERSSVPGGLAPPGGGGAGLRKKR